MLGPLVIIALLAILGGVFLWVLLYYEDDP